MIVSIIVDTRPEIIKMPPIINDYEILNFDYFISHIDQDYSYNMESYNMESYNMECIFFEQLELPSKNVGDWIWIV